VGPPGDACKSCPVAGIAVIDQSEGTETMNMALWHSSGVPTDPGWSRRSSQSAIAAERQFEDSVSRADRALLHAAGILHLPDSRRSR